jgi:hypothetical protein
MTSYKGIFATNISLNVTKKDVEISATASTKEISTTYSLKETSTNTFDTGLDVSLNGFGEETIPQKALFKYNQDAFSISDIFNKSFGKTLIDTQVLTERILFNIGKTNTEPLYLNDFPKFAFSKILADTFSKQDTVSLGLSKPFNDTTNTTIDSVSLTYGGFKYENLSTQDVISFVSGFNRNIYEVVNPTDDFLGAANIDDDQYASIGKFLVDISSSSDVFKVDLSTRLNDSFTKTDSIRLEPNKVQNDTVTRSEMMAFSGGKILNDLTIHSDVLQVNLSKQMLDTSSLTESVKLNIQNYFSQIYVVSDYVGTTYLI